MQQHGLASSAYEEPKLLEALAQLLQKLLDPRQAGLNRRSLLLQGTDALLQIQHALVEYVVGTLQLVKVAANSLEVVAT